MKRKVYVVTYSLIEADDFQNPYIREMAFCTEAEAEKWLAKDYRKTLKDLKNGGTVYDVVEANNYGNNAYVELGTLDEEDVDNSTVEAKHTWRVSTHTVNFKEG